ncbi:MAG TPA: CbiX/SirB N-terminal domain-containing protein [Ramlibacter sp.]|jgi:sirohydrochlorin cobaltochelatase|uniref:sirohydrochlorin chelatase n=1 Tax=Ramlibacter sp. TaxID=1917967 RepID=UPI002D6747D9|nr:CbiX/SirB N-terminal domain-containing protein [Ramlibacter sp.]HZY19260.1 CbiX/SirB N-terminal domain-containing protein [Ramlibacter sp.]
MSRGIVLFGHGSRDPAWRRPMDLVAQRITERSPDTVVMCAFLELQVPDLPSAVASLVNHGLRDITVFPMFLGVGKHAREDLPVLLADIRSRHPELQLAVSRSVGELPAVLDLLAEQALKPTL